MLDTIGQAEIYCQFMPLLSSHAGILNKGQEVAKQGLAQMDRFC